MKFKTNIQVNSLITIVWVLVGVDIIIRNLGYSIEQNLKINIS